MKVIEADNHVVEMQAGLWQMLAENRLCRQPLYCPVQIVSKKTGRPSLERREIGAVLLGIAGEQVAKNAP